MSPGFVFRYFLCGLVISDISAGFRRVMLSNDVLQESVCSQTKLCYTEKKRKLHNVAYKVKAWD